VSSDKHAIHVDCASASVDDEPSSDDEGDDASPDQTMQEAFRSFAGRGRS
jgi:hypothetical protein